MRPKLVNPPCNPHCFPCFLDQQTKDLIFFLEIQLKGLETHYSPVELEQVYWYQKRNDKVPASNPWTLDLAKLIVPNVFIDIELIKDLSNSYHAPTKTARLPNGGCLFDVSRDAIIKCFILNKKVVVEVNLVKLEQEYKRLRRTYQSVELPLHMKTGDNNIILPIPSSKMDPFLVLKFQVCFKNTYNALWQVLEIDVEENMSVGLMRMAIIIQHFESNVEFNFATIIEEKIHKGLLHVKEAKVPIAFKKYSLLCHLILYQN